MNHSQALPLRLASLLLAFLVAATLATTLGACKKGDDGTGDANGTGGASLSSLVIEKLGSSGIDKINLVLVVANTESMADKQSVLSQAIHDLVNGLVNPPCLDDKTNQPIASGQPTDPTQACPAGSTREFPPVEDIHVGLLSSSLGTFGADGCPEKPPASCSGASIPNDDHGHLVTRADPCGASSVPTYQNLGFLQWDPAQTLNPPGIQSASALTTAVTSLVLGDGQLGCSFASQEEAWYRFLVDPTPYQSISLVNNQVQTQGIDDNLLAQRKAFLRPDSLLYIIEVSDEGDGSLKEYSSYPLFAAPELHLPHPSSACHFDPNDPTKATPNDPCCYSCGQNKPSGCTADPACTSSLSYTAADEDTHLRAFGLTSHKARYGIEFFYPPSRYVTALTSPTTTDINGKSVPNPIYENLDPVNYKGSVRDPSRVFYAAVVGVPWQLIARQNPMGVPDLINGVSAVDPTQVGGFKTASELSLVDKTGTVYWDDIAGDPEHYVAPRSPFMVESTVPRSGTDPVTGAQIAPTTTPNGGGSMVGGSVLNDHERTIANPPDDIEYACIFNLPAPRDCTQPGVACDCPSTAGVTTDNPLCQGTMQVKAKAYPGLKDLAIARGMGHQGAVASICPKQINDPTAADYGYRPAVQAILGPLKSIFRATGQCSHQTPLVDANGQAECFFVEARNVKGACSCDPALARAPVATEHQPAVSAIEEDPLDQTDKWNCFCEIAQLSGASLVGCQENQSPAANGWCFVPSAFSAADGCTGGAEAIRFLGTSAPQSGSTVFATCLVP